MARSRGSARPAARPATQTRSASTMAAPAHHAPAPAAPAAAAPPTHYAQPVQQQQPGMFAQMASTAAGVAVGSAVGHTIGAGLTGLFSGSSSAPAEAQPQQVQQFAAAPAQQEQAGRTCEVDARNFTRCLEDNNGNYQICDYYLQQLKACQEAARQY